MVIVSFYGHTSSLMTCCCFFFWENGWTCHWRKVIFLFLSLNFIFTLLAIELFPNLSSCHSIMSHVVIWLDLACLTHAREVCKTSLPLIPISVVQISSDSTIRCDRMPWRRYKNGSVVQKKRKVQFSGRMWVESFFSGIWADFPFLFYLTFFGVLNGLSYFHLSFVPWECPH